MPKKSTAVTKPMHALSPSVSEASKAAPIGSFTQWIMRELMGLERCAKQQNPDARHNQGNQVGEAYFWRAVEKYADMKYMQLMCEDKKKAPGALFADGILPMRDTLGVGSHASLVETPHYVISAAVSEPVSRFNAEALAATLSKEFKKPEGYFLGLIANAKKPTSSTVVWKIEERV